MIEEMPAEAFLHRGYLLNLSIIIKIYVCRKDYSKKGANARKGGGEEGRRRGDRREYIRDATCVSLNGFQALLADILRIQLHSSYNIYFKDITINIWYMNRIIRVDERIMK